MGIKHKSKFEPGQRINDRFTLLYEFQRETTDPSKKEWLW